jgi:nucleoside-diphosphate-sugar epimerase
MRVSEARMTADAHGNFSGKRLVIFGAGYVGSAIAREGIARGMQVTALTRNEIRAAALREAGATAVVADLATDAWHQQIAGGAEFVLNCVSSGGGGVVGYERSYLGGMKSIVAWAMARGAVGTIVYTSSTSVYPQDGGVLVDETATTNGGGERARVLVAAEETLRAGAAADVGRVPSPASSPKRGEGTPPTAVSLCARWFILRLAGIYGPGRHHLLEQVRAGEVSGRGDYHLNLVHLEDICSAIWAVLGAPPEVRNEILNIADDGAATKAEITTWIAAQLGVPAPRFTGEPAAGRRSMTPDRIIASAKAKTLLGWSPRYGSFREGYARDD